MSERPYAFRRRLDRVHQPNRRDPAERPTSDEVALDSGWRICVGAQASDYATRLAQDLQDYLFTSMQTSVLLVRAAAGDWTPGHRTLRLTTRQEVPEFGALLPGRRSYRLLCQGDGAVLCGWDERGLGQGCYYLEDLMNLRQAPFLPRGDVVRRPLFCPRMVHSGWGIDQFPDHHLNAIAHAGMDAILLFVKGVDQTTTGHLDVNDLIDRAASFGLDVYLYSYLVSRVHPADPGAAQYYESTYGALMASCPRARGLVFVGESCEFPSRDPRTTGRLRLDPAPEGKPDPRPSPGWWPCTDYPEWLELLKGVIRRHNPEADRLALVRSLPQDVSLQATFEMFEEVEKGGITTRCVDYTVSFVGPGRYFRSEAREAHARGLRLYAMSNTAGLTWDIGVVPYEPVPYQWARRHAALRQARAEWGLTGLMESHHYGWWPSVVSELAKWAFWEPSPPAEKVLEALARRDFGPAGAPLALKAWRCWSDAIGDYVPTNEDQYGPFRVGPSYPLLFDAEPEPFPSAPYAHFGAQIVATRYRPHRPEDLPAEIALLQRMLAAWDEGVVHMERAAALAPQARREEAVRMLVLGRFVGRCVRTAIHTKEWWLLGRKLRAAADPAEAPGLAAELTRLGEEEIANAEAAIPLVEADSRLGWEPSMEYMTDVEHLKWKIAQLRAVLDEEIPAWCRRPRPAAP
ncbi:MAG: hypothetical protein AB1505_19000 [Candidatus Latescibacterota bacterium]